jgi:multidrug efflux system membrane fusion protein
MPAKPDFPSSRRASRLSRRNAALAAGLLLAAAALVYSSNHLTAAEAAKPTAPASPPAARVTIASVEEKVLVDYEEITGHVDSTETVELRARVSGHLDSVHFQAGQLVKKGDVLFTIDPRWYRAQFDLATARADVAEREAKRADELLAAAAISSEEAEARRARAAEARAALATAQLDLEHTEVRAPIDGRINRALLTAGNLVSGSPGNASLLTTIVSVGDAFVYADIDEGTFLKFNRLAREKHLATEGGRVPVDLQLADETGFPRHGYIESADNRLNPATGSLTLRMVFPNADEALVPGLFARVRIPVGAPQPTLLISERAIGTDQSQKFVLAVTPEHTAAYRTVKLGGTVEGKRVVRAGLKAGDQVIVNGLQRVRPGMPVEAEVATSDPAPSTTRTAIAAR